MTQPSEIDVTFNFVSDTPAGRDPDVASPMLRRYHRMLWSKPLPSGVAFQLTDTRRNAYLYHSSAAGEFWLASDSVIPTFWREARLSHVLDAIPPAERQRFHEITYTIGGMMVFPGERVDGKMTINGARGFHPRIKDRFDLTVECIRRHYRGETSPLADTLARYRRFFDLFGDFRGYVDFFLLQDLVTDGSAVKFFLPFDDFQTSPLPSSAEAYASYRLRAVEFVEARNRRISLAR